MAEPVTKDLLEQFRGRFDEPVSGDVDSGLVPGAFDAETKAEEPDAPKKPLVPTPPAASAEKPIYDRSALDLAKELYQPLQIPGAEDNVLLKAAETVTFIPRYMGGAVRGNWALLTGHNARQQQDTVERVSQEFGRPIDTLPDGSMRIPDFFDAAENAYMRRQIFAKDGLEPKDWKPEELAEARKEARRYAEREMNRIVHQGGFFSEVTPESSDWASTLAAQLPDQVKGLANAAIRSGIRATATPGLSAVPGMLITEELGSVANLAGPDWIKEPLKQLEEAKWAVEKAMPSLAEAAGFAKNPGMIFVPQELVYDPIRWGALMVDTAAAATMPVGRRTIGGGQYQLARPSFNATDFVTRALGAGPTTIASMLAWSRTGIDPRTYAAESYTLAENSYETWKTWGEDIWGEDHWAATAMGVFGGASGLAGDFTIPGGPLEGGIYAAGKLRRAAIAAGWSPTYRAVMNLADELEEANTSAAAVVAAERAVAGAPDIKLDVGGVQKEVRVLGMSGLGPAPEQRVKAAVGSAAAGRGEIDNLRIVLDDAEKARDEAQAAYEALKSASLSGKRSKVSGDQLNEAKAAYQDAVVAAQEAKSRLDLAAKVGAGPGVADRNVILTAEKSLLEGSQKLGAMDADDVRKALDSDAPARAKYDNAAEDLKAAAKAAKNQTKKTTAAAQALEARAGNRRAQVAKKADKSRAVVESRVVALKEATKREASRLSAARIAAKKRVQSGEKALKTLERSLQRAVNAANKSAPNASLAWRLGDDVDQLIETVQRSRGGRKAGMLSGSDKMLVRDKATALKKARANVEKARARVATLDATTNKFAGRARELERALAEVRAAKSAAAPVPSAPSAVAETTARARSADARLQETVRLLDEAVAELSAARRARGPTPAAAPGRVEYEVEGFADQVDQEIMGEVYSRLAGEYKSSPDGEWRVAVGHVLGLLDEEGVGVLGALRMAGEPSHNQSVALFGKWLTKEGFLPAEVVTSAHKAGRNVETGVLWRLKNEGRLAGSTGRAAPAQRADTAKIQSRVDSLRADVAQAQKQKAQAEAALRAAQAAKPAVASPAAARSVENIVQSVREFDPKAAASLQALASRQEELRAYDYVVTAARSMGSRRIQMPMTRAQVPDRGGLSDVRADYAQLLREAQQEKKAGANVLATKSRLDAAESGLLELRDEVAQNIRGRLLDVWQVGQEEAQALRNAAEAWRITNGKQAPPKVLVQRVMEATGAEDAEQVRDMLDAMEDIYRAAIDPQAVSQGVKGMRLALARRKYQLHRMFSPQFQRFGNIDRDIHDAMAATEFRYRTYQNDATHVLTGVGREQSDKIESLDEFMSTPNAVAYGGKIIGGEAGRTVSNSFTLTDADGNEIVQSAWDVLVQKFRSVTFEPMHGTRSETEQLLALSESNPDLRGLALMWIGGEQVTNKVQVALIKHAWELLRKDVDGRAMTPAEFREAMRSFSLSPNILGRNIDPHEHMVAYRQALASGWAASMQRGLDRLRGSATGIYDDYIVNDILNAISGDYSKLRDFERAGKEARRSGAVLLAKGPNLPERGDDANFFRTVTGMDGQDYWVQRSVAERFDSYADDFVKNPYKHGGWNVETSMGPWRLGINLWKRSVVAGLILPDVGYFIQSIMGDWSQMVQQMGFIDATKVTFSTTWTSIPVVNRLIAKAAAERYQKAGGKPVMGGLLNAILNPRLHSVLRGDAGVIVVGRKTGGARISFDQARQYAVEEGVFSTFAGSEDLTNLIRSGDGWWRRVKNWPDAIGSQADVIARNQRMAMFLQELERHGDPTRAGRAVREALYDYANLVTDWERNLLKVMPISPFWSFWKNAINQQTKAVGALYNDPTMARLVDGKLANLKKLTMLQSYVDKASYTSDDVDDLSRKRFLRAFMPDWMADRWKWGYRKLSELDAQYFTGELGRRVDSAAFAFTPLTYQDSIDLMLAPILALAYVAGEADRNYFGNKHMPYKLAEGAEQHFMEPISGVLGPVLAPILVGGMEAGGFNTGAFGMREYQKMHPVVPLIEKLMGEELTTQDVVDDQRGIQYRRMGYVGAFLLQNTPILSEFMLLYKGAYYENLGRAPNGSAMSALLHGLAGAGRVAPRMYSASEEYLRWNQDFYDAISRRTLEFDREYARKREK